MSLHPNDMTPSRLGAAKGIVVGLPIAIVLWIFLVPAAAWAWRLLHP